MFDGNHYCSLLGQKVEIDGQTALHTYFSDLRDIAFGLATDGFGPFKHQESTAWPLILFNFNLGSEVQCHIKKVLPLGAIPGPKKPIDVDSFQWPAISELNQLQLGVRAYDDLSWELFLLHAYLILIFSDIPAISMLMNMKGHNGWFVLNNPQCSIRLISTSPGPEDSRHRRQLQPIFAATEMCRRDAPPGRKSSISSK